MEPRFGRDFSSVRLHSGRAATQSALGLRAEAYTVGNNIVLASGPDPSPSLLAHELAHVVQQTGGSPAARIGATSLGIQAKGLVYGGEYRLAVPEMPKGKVFGGDDLDLELRRLGYLEPDDSDAWGWSADGYYFTKSSGQGETFKMVRVLDAHEIRNDKGEIVAYRIVSWLGQSGAATKQTPSKAQQAPTGQKAGHQPPEPGTSSTARRGSGAKPSSAKTPEQLRAEIDALPQIIRDLVRPGATSVIRPEDLPQVLRIAKKLQALRVEELQLYKLISKQLAADLDAFERSVDVFVKFRTELEAAKAGQSEKGEPTLEQKLQATWSQLDEKRLAGMTTHDKEELARKIAAEQRDITLGHMRDYPGQTAADMAKGMVRLDKTAKAVVDDIKEVADGNKSSAARAASGLGAYNKAMTAVASVVFVALLFVPGVNLVELAVAGLAVAASALVLSAAESDLRIQAAGESTTTAEFKSQTERAAAAQVNVAVSAAMLALTLALKIVARIPLPGRFQNVGAALRAAQKAFVVKSGIGAAWLTVKAELLSRLAEAKAGLREALSAETRQLAGITKSVGNMTGDQFLQHLADGDPALVDLGIPVDQAKATQQLASTPAGKSAPEQLRQESVRALQDAPVEAGKRVEQFIKDVDDAADRVGKTQTPEELKSVVDEASKTLDAEAQSKRAIADEQGYVKKRVAGALREQTQSKLTDLNKQQAQTQAAIERLEAELHAAEREVKSLSKAVIAEERGTPRRAELLKDFNEAKAKLLELKEADELGGQLEARTRLAAREAALLESLGLKRPALRVATKAAIKKAGKVNSEGKFLDANTGEVIEGEPVYGHKFGREHRRLVLEASEQGMSQEQFNDWVNNHPEWFQLETEANNLSHRFEKQGFD